MQFTINLIAALGDLGLPTRASQGTLYVWQRVPDGMTSMDFAARLMEPEIAIVVTLGNIIAEEVEGGLNPGEGYVRFALTPTVDDVKIAAKRIAAMKL